MHLFVWLDYQTGVCSCFNGQFGSDCSISEALYHQTSVSSSGVSVSSGFFGGNMAFDFVAAAAESGGAQMFSNVWMKLSIHTVNFV